MSKQLIASPQESRTLAHLPERWQGPNMNVLFDVLPVGILNINRAGFTVDCNDSFERITGLSRREIVGRPPFLGWAEDALEENAALLRILRAGGSHRSLRRFPGKKSADSHRTLDLRIEEVRENGIITGAVIVVQEAASVTATDRDSEKAVTEVGGLEHMEMLNRVLDQAAHDFNNLLSPLKNYPEMIRLNYRDKNKVFKYLEGIETATAKMAEMNRDILILGRRGRYKRDKLDVNGLIENVLNQQALPGTVSVRRSMSAELMPVYGGAEELKRLFAHLLKSAREVLTDGDVLTIRTENYYLDHSAGRYRGVAGGEYVKVTVGGGSTGMNEGALCRAYGSADGGARGMNALPLGMKVVHTVLKNHQGYMDVEVLGDKETFFYVYLPILREAVAEKTRPAGSKRKERILVVDDDPGQLNLIQDILSFFGYQVVAVQNGDEALAACRPSRPGVENFDLLVMDLVLHGGGDGVAVYRRIKDVCPKQKSVLLSGFAPEGKVEELRKMGVGPHLRKPLNIPLLLQVVRQELDTPARAALH